MTGGLQLGIDVGGTFTDILVRSAEDGTILSAFKVLSTPSRPEEAVLSGVDAYFAEAGAAAHGAFSVFHATTVGTNTLIEKKGAPTALVTTRGFRDVLALRRQVRPRLYDLAPVISPPLVDREFRFEIDERMSFNGKVLSPLSDAAIDELVEEIAAAGVTSVAICLLHSYANDAHEKAIAAAIRSRLPRVYVTVSSDVCPEFREFERTSTATVNSYIGPRVTDYVRSLAGRLSDKGSASLSIVKSNGGLTSAVNAGRYPVHLIESGPAAGIMASAALGKALGASQLICFDLGGTTAKAGVVIEGQPRLTTEFYADRFVDGRDIGGYPIKSPVIDVIEIGAGGGSLAQVALGGLLKVGPESAGASPGPACYGLGGTLPTLTDAHLIVGHLGTDTFGPRGIAMDRDLAVRAMRKHVADPLGWPVERAAHGVIEIATAHMIEMVRVATLQRGLDPRDFALMAYGGGGPLHACDIAQEIGIRRVIVPPYPGLFSAIGTLLGDVRHDFVRTLLRDVPKLEARSLEAGFSDLEAKAATLLTDDEAATGKEHAVSLQRSLDVRFKGQLFELNIPFGADDAMTAAEIDRRFRVLYCSIYGYDLPDHETELVNLRLVAVRSSGATKIPTYVSATPAPSRSRALRDRDGRTRDIAVFQRSSIQQGQTIQGPCIIEDTGATIRLRHDQRATVIKFGALQIESIAAE
jgi:N-methylhydantoinase A